MLAKMSKPEMAYTMYDDSMGISNRYSALEHLLRHLCDHANGSHS